MAYTSTRIDIADAEGLHAATAQYERLVAAGQPAVFEVVLAPGEYADTQWRLDDLGGAGLIDVVVRARDPAERPHLRSTTVNVQARSAELRGLRFADARNRSPLVRLVGAGGALSLVDCEFSSNIGDDWPPGLPLVELAAGYGRQGDAVLLRRCWFVTNRSLTPAALIAVATEPPSGWSKVSVEDCAFVGNSYAVVLDLQSVGELRARRVFALLDDGRAPGHPPSFVHVASELTGAALADSVLVARNDEALFSTSVPGARGVRPQLDACQLITIREAEAEDVAARVLAASRREALVASAPDHRSLAALVSSARA